MDIICSMFLNSPPGEGGRWSPAEDEHVHRQTEADDGQGAEKDMF